MFVRSIAVLCLLELAEITTHPFGASDQMIMHIRSGGHQSAQGHDVGYQSIHVFLSDILQAEKNQKGTHNDYNSCTDNMKVKTSTGRQASCCSSRQEPHPGWNPVHKPARALLRNLLFYRLFSSQHLGSHFNVVT
jgi:hypothetical protein